jgi:hypothetical protein
MGTQKEQEEAPIGRSLDERHGAQQEAPTETQPESESSEF